MAKFTDNADPPREWELHISLFDVARIKRETKRNIVDGFDFKTNAKSNIFQAIGEDPTVLFDVLYVLCRKQCEERGVSGEEFAEGLFGDSLESATTALWEALCDFFPPQKRKVMRALAAKMQTSQKLLSDADFDKVVTRIIDRVMSQSSTSVTNSPDFAELTPTPEACVS